MTQPAQPGQDANAGAVTPATPAADNSHQIEATGANARLRQDAGLPPADGTKDAIAVSEPAADGKLREATPGFESVPTVAHDVNTSARAIDNLNTSGPVRVREASFSTADGQTLSGNVYPKGGNEIFMSKDGQKYNVDKNDQGEISLRPINGNVALSVQDNSAKIQSGKSVAAISDQRIAPLNVNAAGAAAERSAAQQAQQQRAVADQQRAERNPELQKLPAQPMRERSERTDRSEKREEVGAEKIQQVKPDKSVAEDLSTERSNSNRNQPPAEEENHRAPVAGSGSASTDQDGGRSRSNSEQADKPESQQASAVNQHVLESPANAQLNIKVGDDARQSQHLDHVVVGADKHQEQNTAASRDKTEEKATESAAANAAAARNAPTITSSNQAQNAGLSRAEQAAAKRAAASDETIGKDKAPAIATASKATAELAPHTMALPEAGHAMALPEPKRESTHSLSPEKSTVAAILVKPEPPDKSIGREIKTDVSKNPLDTAYGAEAHRSERQPDLKDEEGIIATGTDGAAPLGTNPLDLVEKEKPKNEEPTDEMDTLITRNAMIAAMLTDKAKKEASEKEEQLAINDSKKKDEDKRRRYVVKEKDTLESIAKKQLRDIRLAALIYEINKHMLPLRMEKGKQVAEPRAGTSIWLPSDSDIRDFRGRLYSGSAGAAAPAVPGRPAGGRDASDNDDFGDKHSLNSGLGTGSNAIAAGLMDAAVAKSQVRQSNIEKVLGPITSAKVPEGGRIRYIVRLSDTIDGVAIKHPALKDVELWPLLAQLNNLTDDIDSRGKPTAELRRGMVLDIPSPSEIESFRAGEEFEQEPEEIPTVGLPATSSHRVIDLDAPTVKVSVVAPAEAQHGTSNYEGLPTMPLQAAQQPNVLPPQPNISQAQTNVLPPQNTTPFAQQSAAPPPALASLPLPSGQEPAVEPLPTSLFQAYQSGQPTMPLSPVQPSSVAPTLPTSAPLPLTAPSSATEPLPTFAPVQANAPLPLTSQPSPAISPNSAPVAPVAPLSPPAPVWPTNPSAVQQAQTQPFPQVNSAPASPPVTPVSSPPGFPGMPAAPAPPVPNAAIADLPVPANDPLTWHGAQSITSQNDETHILPRGDISHPVLTAPAQPAPAAPVLPNVSYPQAGSPPASTPQVHSGETPNTPSAMPSQQIQNVSMPLPAVQPPAQPNTNPDMLGGWQQTTSSLVRLELNDDPAQQAPQTPTPTSPQQPLVQPRGAQPVPLQPSSATLGAPPMAPTDDVPVSTAGGAPSPGEVPTTVEAAIAPPAVAKPVNRPSAADLMKRAPIVVGDRYMWELDRSVRLVKSAVRWDPAIGVFRSQLEVLYRDTWYPVIFYEVFPQGAVRHEYIGGGKRKSVKMDLPPSAVQELADNDLVNNWQAYCQRFVHQLTHQK